MDRMWAAAPILLAALAGSSVSANGQTPATAAPGQPAATSAFYARHYARTPTVAELTSLGRTLFYSPALSANGRLACASCHDPRYGFAAPNDRPVQRGGARLAAEGVRAVPALRYLQTLPSFAQHRFEEEPDDSQDQGPSGGYTWDGRADSAHDQARLPLLSAAEMGNPSPSALIRRIRDSALATPMREVFGPDVFDDPQRAFDALRWALEVFLQDPATFILTPAATTTGCAVGKRSALRNCAACGCSTIRARAIARAAIPVRRSTAPSRSSPTTGTRRWGRRAIARFAPTPIPGISTWVCAVPCVRTCAIIPSTAACSECPRCATWRSDAVIFTTGCFTTCARCCSFMPGVTASRSAGTRARPPAACGSSTICPGFTGTTSSVSRHSGKNPALRPRSRMPSSMTCWLS